MGVGLEGMKGSSKGTVNEGEVTNVEVGVDCEVKQELSSLGFTVI